MFYRSMMCLDNSESNPNFIWGVLYFFPLKVALPCVVPLISRQSHFLSVWWKGYLDLLRPTTFLLLEGGKINYGFYVRLIGRRGIRYHFFRYRYDTDTLQVWKVDTDMILILYKSEISIPILILILWSSEILYWYSCKKDQYRLWYQFFGRNSHFFYQK